ncbi:MFS transporter [Nocardioides sp.]|uniref:MFS transporter n=1 Tax=Nocardioides sp. TaxID=35761 RepID=UPI003D13BEAA
MLGAREGVSDIKRHLDSTFLALRYRDYRLFAAGQAISVCGTWMQKVAQSWLVLELTDSGLMLGVTVAFQTMPTLLFTAFGGSLADRFDRRRILLATGVLGMLPALALGVVVRLDAVVLWMVLAAALFQGLVDALERPARMTLVNDIVVPRVLPNAVTLNNVIQNAGKLVGPAIAGVLIATLGLAPAFFTNAASYVAVVIGLFLIRPAYVEERAVGSRGSVRETLKYVSGRPELAASLTMLAVIGVFGYNFQVLAPILIRDVFAGGATAVGLAFTLMGLGGVVGGLAFAGRIRGSAWSQLATAGLFCVALILTALAPTLWLAFGALFIMGAANVVFSSASGAYLQLTSDRHMRGRTMALYIVALAGSSTIGGPLQGFIAEVTSARVALLVAATVTALACAVMYRHLRARQAGTLTAKRSGPQEDDSGVAAPDTGSIDII